ncbi:MAG: 50S ribosomal protein L4 [Clostridia bacterium]|nr:50S ribosomal protein L4 [Clostridia bacterium]
MKVSVLDMEGKKSGTVELNDAIFGIVPNVSAMHIAVVNFLANARQGTQSTKTRAEVSGGGRKPWRQKGTGHARQGSTRAPQWTHGGIALGPKPRDYSFTINKKVRRLALKSALSSKVADNECLVLKELALEEYKTKTVAATLKNIGAGKKVLMVLPENDKKLVKSAANIEGVKTAQVNTINVYDILNCDTLVIFKDAVKKLEEVYA